MPYVITRDPTHSYTIIKQQHVERLGDAVIHAKEVHDDDDSLHVTVCKDVHGHHVIAVHHERQLETAPKNKHNYTRCSVDQQSAQQCILFEQFKRTMEDTFIGSFYDSLEVATAWTWYQIGHTHGRVEGVEHGMSASSNPHAFSNEDINDLVGITDEHRGKP